MMDFFTLRIRKNKVMYTIKEAALAGFFVAFMTLMFGFMTPGIMNAAYITEIAAYILLSFGVLFRNRLSAVLITLYFFIAKVYLFILFSASGQTVAAMSQIFVGALFMMVFLRGTKAIFVYHKHIKS